MLNSQHTVMHASNHKRSISAQDPMTLQNAINPRRPHHNRQRGCPGAPAPQPSPLRGAGCCRDDARPRSCNPPGDVHNTTTSQANPDPRFQTKYIHIPGKPEPPDTTHNNTTTNLNAASTAEINSAQLQEPQVQETQMQEPQVQETQVQEPQVRGTAEVHSAQLQEPQVKRE
jgi:hypothetical protein